MVKYMDRLIGSAQRRITIPDPNFRGLERCSELVFHIQGLDLKMADQILSFDFSNMASRGIKEKKCPSLRLMDRLFRRPGFVGEVFEDEHNVMNVTFWTEPELYFFFDLNPEGHVELWSEAYIMVRSAGFDLMRPETEPKYTYGESLIN